MPQHDPALVDRLHAVWHAAFWPITSQGSMAHYERAGIVAVLDELAARGAISTGKTEPPPEHRTGTEVDDDPVIRFGTRSEYPDQEPWTGLGPDATEEARTYQGGDIVRDDNGDLYWRTWDNTEWRFLLRYPGRWTHTRDCGPIRVPLTLVVRAACGVTISKTNTCGVCTGGNLARPCKACAERAAKPIPAADPETELRARFAEAIARPGLGRMQVLPAGQVPCSICWALTDATLEARNAHADWHRGLLEHLVGEQNKKAARGWGTGT